MKKEIEKVEIELIQFEDDIITASGESATDDPRPM